MKGHTGGVLSLGKGAVYGTSTRHRLNSRSSTESELIAVADVMPQVLWSRYYLEAQGYDVTDNVVFQDNKSAILLEKNGRASSSKRTRHINIRYFFVKDRIAAGELSVEFCPTLEMVGDFFTKPLQGTPFRKFRDFIMNANPTIDYSQDPRSVLGNAGNEKVSSSGAAKVPNTRSYAEALTGSPMTRKVSGNSLSHGHNNMKRHSSLRK